MTATLRFIVHGIPASQGSKRPILHRHTGRPVLIESNDPKLRTWRQDVAAAALAARQTTLGPPLHPGFRDGPVLLYVVFYLPRPKWHYGTRGGESYLKPHAPIWVDKKPDCEKCVRSVADALTTAGVYRDDAQIAELTAVMKYAGGHAAELDNPGAVITVAPLVEHAPDEALLEIPRLDR